MGRTGYATSVNAGPRTILITGASSGIGRAVALMAADRGEHLTLVARDETALKDTARRCESVGAASATVCAADVGDDAAMAWCIDETVERHGHLDAVVHCAAVIAYGRTEEIPTDVFDRVLRTNLHGSINVARHAVRQLRRQRHGTLVLVGSVAGHIASPQISPYVVTKWGVRALARQLQIENRDLDEVDIAYVAPGGVDTPIYAQGANYLGVAGRPPPPVAAPERVAHMVLKRVDKGRGRTQTTWTNQVMRLGFTMVPRFFDALAGPMFRMVLTDRTSVVEPTTGNVFDPLGSEERVHGGVGSPWAAMVRNVMSTVKDAGR
jgi:short-subunit dehydrogenase